MRNVLGVFAGWTTLVTTVGGLLPACSDRPENVMTTAMFAPCPDSPNCVSSDARDSRHAISPFVLKSSQNNVWPEIRAAVRGLPRTRVVVDGENYLHAECRSGLLGFVDDLEIQLRPGEGLLAVRSASRSGYYDFGVNRRRVETLRSLLQNRGPIQ